MRGEKRGLTVGSVLTIVLTICVIAGYVVFFCAFQSGENVVMTAQKMAGLIGGGASAADDAQAPATVRTVTVTLAPSLSTAPPEPNNK